MKRSREVLLFALLAALVLCFQFRAAFGDGHLLYPMVLEDPGARYSLMPWDAHAARLLRQGEFPLWNSLNGAGSPLLANLQTSFLMPLKWPYYILRAPRLLDLFVIARLALAGAFVFALARALGRSRPGAAAAGLALALSGYLMKHQNMVNVSSEMWLPLLLLLGLRERDGHRAGRTLLSAAAYALVAGGGNPEAAAYVAGLHLAFLLVIARDRAEAWRLALVAFAAPLALGGLIAAAQLLPFAEYLGAGWHIHDPALSTLGRHPAGLIGSLVAPWMLGPAGTDPNQILSAPYLGAAVVFLALIGVVHPGGSSRAGRFFAAAALVLLGIVYALPGFDLLTRLPPLDRFGNVKFAMFGVSLTAALLAGAGVDAIRSGGLKPRLTALALAAASLLFLGGAVSARRYGALAPGGIIPPFFGLAATATLALVSVRRQKAGADGAPGRAAIAILVLAVELCLLFYGFRRDTAFPAAMARAENPEIPEALAPVAAEPGARFTAVGGALHPDLNLFLGLSDLRSFEALYPRRYVEAIGRIEGFGLDRAVENFFSHGWMFDVRPENLDSPLLDRFAVRYVISREELSVPGLTLVRSGDYRVYRNYEAGPRIDADFTADSQPKIVAENSGRLTVDVTGPAVFVADVYFPGWTAEVDGWPAVITPDQEVFRKVLTGGDGPHRVVFSYVPIGFRVGLWMSLTTIMAMVLFTAEARRRRAE